MNLNFLKNHQPSSIFWPLSLAGLVIAIGATKIANFDIWWHLKTGEVITQTMRIPRFDIFSYTATGNPWMNHEWLFQVLAWNIYDPFGLAAFTLFKLLGTIGIAIVTFKNFDILTRSKSAALWGTAIVLIAIADRVMARPFLITLFLIALFFLQLNRFLSGRRRLLWELPLLTVLWINLHAGGLLSPQIVVAFAIGESLQSIVVEKFGWTAPAPLCRESRRHLWLIGLLCIAACAITPHGIQTFTFPFTHMKMDNIMSFTQEWLPVWDPRLDGIVSQIIFRAILVLMPISYIIGRRTVRLSHLMLSIVTALLIMKGKRFTPDFIVINLPLIFFNFREAARRVPLTPGAENLRRWGSVLTIAMLSALLLREGIPATVHGGTAGQLGIGTTSTFAPVQMVEFLDENDIHGNVFNEMGLGSYLLFKRWPSDAVFIDGRTPVYGDDFFEEYTNSLRNSRSFEEFDQRYKFDYLLFNSYQAWNLRHMHVYFWQNPAWRLVFAGCSGFIYLRDIPRFREKIRYLELKENPLIEEMKRQGEFGKNIY